MNKRVSSYGAKPLSTLDRLIQTVRTRKISKIIKNGETILDLGCGYRGEMLYALEERIKKGIGIDIRVKPAESKRIKLIEGRVDTKLPFDNGIFEVVTALAIIEHVKDPETMLREARRVLAKNGTLLLTTPSLYGKLPLEIMAALRIISREEIADHKRYYTAGSLAQALDKAGFRKITVKHFGLGWLNLVGVAKK